MPSQSRPPRIGLNSVQTRVLRNPAGRTGMGQSALEGGHQARVSPGCRGVDAGHPLDRETRDIVRTAGLGSGTAQPFASERLAFDHRADLVAVDVEIADPRML